MREARRDLLERITQFALKHDLAVNSTNLALICSALSGSHRQLAQAFAAREISGEIIDQRWLDTLVRLEPEANDRLSELDTLMEALESTIVRFGQTTQNAAEETGGYRKALDQQISAMNTAQGASGNADAVSRVLEISRTMLAGIADAHSAMQRSQNETQALRESLAQARAEADVDHLTRLPNRRAFERRLAAAETQARENGEALSIAFCDIDRFKSINDTHGHDAGDRVLCAVAATLDKLSSDNCFVARHGGEEFVVLFYGLAKVQALAKLDGVRRAMAAKQLVNRESGRAFGKITFSGGVAEVTETIEPRSALARADAALYRAKEEGRNRILTG